MHHVELSRRAKRDLKRLDAKTRDRMIGVLERNLAADPQPEKLDIKQLKGRPPWLRLRVGEYRILYRPLTSKEIKVRASSGASTGFLVERVVKRGDLERAAKALE